MSVRKVLFLAFCLALVASLSLTVRAVCLQPATFRGHPGRVLAVVASPDGKTLASMSEDKTIKVWDVATRKEQATLDGRKATFSPDGKTLAWIELDDRTIRLWDVLTRKEGTALREHGSDVCSIALSPDGRILASGSSTGTVRLWDVATGKARATYRGHTSAVDPVKFSPDGKTLASGSSG